MVDYKKEPIANIVFGLGVKRWRFIAGVFVTATMIAMGSILASVYSNHYGYFGPIGQFEFYNGRPMKIAYLTQLDKSSLPDAWIIGSSNSMPFQPKSVAALFSVEKVFNLGAYWGRVEDLWAWSNVIVNDLKVRPKLIILCVEPWSFSDDQRGPPLLAQYRRRLIATPELAKYLPGFSRWRYELARILDALSFQSFRTLIRMTQRHRLTRVRHPPLLADTDSGSLDPAEGPYLATRSPFDADGTNRGLSGTDPAPFLPDYVNQLYQQMNTGSSPDRVISNLSPERREAVEAQHIRLDAVVTFLPLFKKTVSLLNDHDVGVGVIMMPIHPYFFDLLAVHTRHLEHLQAVRDLLQETRNEFSNVWGVLDASHIARFGGSPFAFHDKFHMTPVNTDLVLQKLRRGWMQR